VFYIGLSVVTYQLLRVENEQLKAHKINYILQVKASPRLFGETLALASNGYYLVH